jgi:signal transduction histidine kinase/CheY-like chemotaxis protein/CHASE3 domain sensor protein/HAMP domain-containing protein
MEQNYKRNLLIGFGISLIILILSSIASYVSITNLLKSAELVNHTNEVIQDLEGIISYMKDAETGQRGFLLTKDDNFLEPYRGKRELVDSLLTDFKKRTADNAVQQNHADTLRALVARRFAIFEESIQAMRNNQIAGYGFLKDGKIQMDQIRRVIRESIDAERSLLQSRTESMNRFALFTPPLIIFASIAALIITLMFYFRISKDIGERIKLQKQLEEKDREITSRIRIIQNIAEKISAGDYAIRVDDTEKDSLGSVAFSLNKMAQSLDTSFRLLSDKEWFQTGVAGLNETMVGEKDIQTISRDILEFTTAYTSSEVGALYLQDKNHLTLVSGVALSAQRPTKISLGEGLIGQCATSGKEMMLTDISEDSVLISFAEASLKPKNVFIMPVVHERRVKGVLELSSLKGFSKREIEYLHEVSSNIGMGINTAQSRKRLQELLEETQAQTEELQSQHSELESLNAEMESQTQKLQASEEELKVQQEELMQANQEMEERTRMLEEKNQIIIERNLEIQKKADELAQSTRYKSEFLANMSHELRTPLNSILLLSRLMAENTDHNLTTDQVEYARVIQSSGNGLLSLIDEILDLSKIEAGKMTLEYAHVSMDEIISDMRSLFDPLAKEKALEFKTIVSGEAPDALVTDKLRLEQILKNLLSNALKFTSKGFVSLEISATAGSPFIDFTVRDTGIGISEDKQALVFEAFQQADGSTRRKFGGTGLGLSISRELARLLGGEITVKSQLGTGSAFTIAVPPFKMEVLPAITPGIIHLETESFRPKEEPRTKLLASSIPDDIEDDRKNVAAGDKVILIVEDDITFARAVLDFTRKRGYKGVVVVRGDQAVDMAMRWKPVAVLLDIILPVKDGWEIMDELKSNASTRHIPVHIMSSMEVKKESLRKGAIDFVTKPVNATQMQQIFGSIESALSLDQKKVVILEENKKHAEALSYYLQNANITTAIAESISDVASAIQQSDARCVILDMGVPAMSAYEALEQVKKNPALENLPIIIFTGKNLSRVEEARIRQYADSIIVKTAHSYQRLLDEAGIFLHLVEEKSNLKKVTNQFDKLGALAEVLRNKKVLIADDDVRNIYSISKALEIHKMKIITATDGKEALRQLEENPDIDIVLMDMMMPEMDGYETTTKIREQSRFKNLPVLAVTAKAMTGDREKCISAGASDYISKPVDMDQLVSLLRVWLYDKGY